MQIALHQYICDELCIVTNDLIVGFVKKHAWLRNA